MDALETWSRQSDALEAAYFHDRESRAGAIESLEARAQPVIAWYPVRALSNATG